MINRNLLRGRKIKSGLVPATFEKRSPMKRFLMSAGLILSFVPLTWAQQKATIREYTKTFKTYPYSDPDPVPAESRIYPYYRFDGYTDNPVQKEWKVVELENDYIRVMILPEVGGKIWSAVEKSTGEAFIYDNHVIKFRDISMRGPWTSGGIEANYGIIGHTPNCATPVDYKLVKKDDGSVSCIIGVLDMLTGTSWRLDINLPKDKAYFTTSSFWYNSSPLEQPYYTWMNAGIKAGGNLEFVYPGNHYLGHRGEYGDWPVNHENGKDVAFYNQNNFGGSKSYHVFGEYSGFYGGFWHDDNFGMGRYAPRDEKPGKKIWIWGLSNQGMIWEKLLTDTDGQYVEVQSGRLFNQAESRSTFSPFKHRGFAPGASDTWTEYWFPVVKTRGLVDANNYGALNIKPGDGWLRIWFSPLQAIHDEIKITDGDKTVYSKKVDLNTLELFADSIRFNGDPGHLIARVGETKLVYHASPEDNKLNRPIRSPEGFDWNSVYGHYIKGREDLHQRNYEDAEKELRASLDANPDYVPALSDLSMLLYRRMHYQEALEASRRALSVDTYDPAANYYYALTNLKLGNTVDAKDGFDIASQDMAFRSVAYLGLSKIDFRENDFSRALRYARECVDFNRFSVGAYQLMAMIYRLQNNRAEAEKALATLESFDPISHFAAFERYLWDNSDQNRSRFIDQITCELPQQTYLELAVWYHDLGRDDEAAQVLKLSPPAPEITYWLSYLEHKPVDGSLLQPGQIFPSRPETAEVLEQLIRDNDAWLLKYHLALIEWHLGNTGRAGELFLACGDQPDDATFYASRFDFFNRNKALKGPEMPSDLLKAARMDPGQWRYGRTLANYYLADNQPGKAAEVASQYTKKFPGNYYLGLLYAKILLKTGQYAGAATVLKNIHVLPNEGATEGRRLYKEAHLMLALDAMEKHHYKKAKDEIALSRLWPENLGVGKPYQADLDERTEDWLEWLCDTKSGNSAAAKDDLNRILNYSGLRDNEGMINASVNNLVTAWALEKSGKAGQAEDFLNKWLGQEERTTLAEHVVEMYHGNASAVPESASGDENEAVLEKLIASGIMK